MNRFREMGLHPETAEEVKSCAEPNGMRRRLREYAYRGNSLVHHVFQMAEARGLSGEDTMTVLAFEALKRLEICEDAALQTVMADTTRLNITVTAREATELLGKE